MIYYINFEFYKLFKISTFVLKCLFALIFRILCKYLVIFKILGVWFMSFWNLKKQEYEYNMKRRINWRRYVMFNL